MDWRFPRGLDWIYDKMDGLWLDSVLGSEEEAATFFSRWEKGVRDSVPKDRLLVFQAKEGWEPLCQFLLPLVQVRNSPWRVSRSRGSTRSPTSHARR